MIFFVTVTIASIIGLVRETPPSVSVVWLSLPATTIPSIPLEERGDVEGGGEGEGEGRGSLLLVP